MSRRCERLDQQDASGFHSGVHPLDDYLHRHARTNAEQGWGVTYLLLKGDDDPGTWPELIGYFTVSMCQISSEVVQRLTSSTAPKYPLPAALIGRLACDLGVRGAGVGADLLKRALLKVVEVSDQVGCCGVVVDAKDESVMRFYEKYGFKVVSSEERWPRRCFLPMQTLRGALQEGDRDDS